jgi:hypothetical protein
MNRRQPRGITCGHRERLLKITLAGTDAKAKDNENLVQKADTVKRWCVGGGGLRSAPRYIIYLYIILYIILYYTLYFKLLYLGMVVVLFNSGSRRRDT